MRDLARTYWRQGKLETAVKIQEKDSRMLELGLNHPETQSATKRLAEMYQCQERWEDAKVLQGKLVEAGTAAPASSTA
jgi:hypothetical protein